MNERKNPLEEALGGIDEKLIEESTLRLYGKSDNVQKAEFITVKREGKKSKKGLFWGITGAAAAAAALITVGGIAASYNGVINGIEITLPPDNPGAVSTSEPWEPSVVTTVILGENPEWINEPSNFRASWLGEDGNGNVYAFDNTLKKILAYSENGAITALADFDYFVDITTEYGFLNQDFSGVVDDGLYFAEKTESGLDVRIYSADSFKKVREFVIECSNPEMIKLSQNGRYAAVTTLTGETENERLITLFDGQSGEKITAVGLTESYLAEVGYYNRISFVSSEGKLILSCGNDSAVLCDLINTGDFKPLDILLAVCCDFGDGIICINTDKSEATIIDKDGNLYSITLPDTVPNCGATCSPDGKYILLTEEIYNSAENTYDNSVISVYNSEDMSLIRVVEVYNAIAVEFHITNSGRVFYTCVDNVSNTAFTNAFTLDTMSDSDSENYVRTGNSPVQYRFERFTTGQWAGINSDGEVYSIIGKHLYGDDDKKLELSDNSAVVMFDNGVAVAGYTGTQNELFCVYNRDFELQYKCSDSEIKSICAISPDGKLVAGLEYFHSVDDSSHDDIVVSSIDNGVSEYARIGIESGIDVDSNLMFSADGSAIAFYGKNTASDTKITGVADIATGEVIYNDFITGRITAFNGGFLLTPSYMGPGAAVMDLKGNIETLDYISVYEAPYTTISPDGNYIAAVTHNAEKDTIRILNRAGVEVKKLDVEPKINSLYIDDEGTVYFSTDTTMKKESLEGKVSDIEVQNEDSTVTDESKGDFEAYEAYTLPDTPSGEYCYPVDVPRVTYPTKANEGSVSAVDFAHVTFGWENCEGTNVYAVASGTVKTVVTDFEQSRDLGRYIVIDHGNGLETTYFHCGDITVSEGDRVEKGQVIAYVGKTGWATGPCLGFAAKENGEYINALELF